MSEIPVRSGIGESSSASGGQNFVIKHLSDPGILRTDLIGDVLTGFAMDPKTLPPKYFYDVDGSGIFDQITDLPEYYVARAETEALEVAAPEIAAMGTWKRLIELGSGSSRKTGILLDGLSDSADSLVYSPFDISRGALETAEKSLVRRYPTLAIEAYVGDFLGQDLETALQDSPPNGRLVVFLGSTLGNLPDAQRTRFYERLAQQLAPGDGLLVGVDLKKDPEVIQPAYNDQQGVTAEFNKNVLRVLNRELGADIDTDDFVHFAPYLEQEGRIEMRLYAQRDVTITFDADELPDYEVEGGDYILTELSKKYDQEELSTELQESGLETRGWWTDHDGLVGLMLIGTAGE